MKILMVSSYLPYPLFSGGHIRLYNLIKLLSKNHKITLVCEKRNYQKEKDVEEVKKYCEKIVTFDRKTQWSFENIVKTGFSLSPFLIVGHNIPAMKMKIGELLKTEGFDLIHVETSYVMQNLPETRIPIVLVEHNIEYLVYKRFAEHAPLPLRPLLYIDVLKLKYWEEKAWKKVRKLVAVSEIEKEIMGKKRGDVLIVSNGVDTEKYKVLNIKYKAAKTEKRALFIGDFKWVQNRDAAEWILRDIWPKIHNSVKLWIVGRKIPDNIKAMGDDGVFFDENAPEDTNLIFQKADILFAPIRVGGGTSFKILEAMASGVPVMTTLLGNAINAKDNLEIIVGKTSEDFVKSIKKLLEDKKFYEEISANARKLVEEKYDWKKIVEKLESVYKSAI